MELYFGGAYNGKLSYIKNQLGFDDNEINYCNNNDIDYSKKVISGLHIFIYDKLSKSESPLQYFIDNIDKFQGKIIICDDLSSGIVPLKREDRVWREETGKVLQFLSGNSNRVVRIFCGIPQVLKDE